MRNGERKAARLAKDDARHSIDELRQAIEKYRTRLAERRESREQGSVLSKQRGISQTDVESALIRFVNSVFDLPQSGEAAA